MALNGRVHPNCPLASNPYHECAVACLEKISRGQGGKEEKKSGSILHYAVGFGRKKKVPESLPKSPQVVEKNSEMKPVKHADPALSPSYTSTETHTETTLALLLSQLRSEDRSSGDSSFDEGVVQSFESNYTPGSATPDHAKSPSRIHASHGAAFQSSESNYKSGNVTPNRRKSTSRMAASSSSDEGMVQSSEWNYTSGNVTPDHQKSPLRIHASPKAAFFPFVGHASPKAFAPSAKDVRKITGPVLEHMNTSLSNESDEDETQSVISDSCVSVGRYHVRPSVASTLQLIFNKHGDIAEGSRLESASMRAFYLEGVCSVIQELQCIAFKHLTKSKLKEMFAVVRDVESAQIDVSWLRAALDELAEALELTSQHRAFEEAKSNCDLRIETARKEIESMTEDLAQKEKAVADTKARIAEREAQLCELVDEFSDLDDTVDSLWSKLENFHTTPLGNGIF